MVLATELYVEHRDLALSPTIRSLDDVELGVFTDAGTDPENDVYIFWFEAPDLGIVQRALAEDHTVADFSVLADAESPYTCQIEYSDDTTLITPAIVENGGLTVEARSYSNGWLLTLQLRDHDALFALKEYADEHDIHMDIMELHHGSGTDDDREYGLTDAQREALVAAFEQGYYDKPRNASLDELAETLDISTTAVSGRLRRGSAQLIESVLSVDRE